MKHMLDENDRQQLKPEDINEATARLVPNKFLKEMSMYAQAR